MFGLTARQLICTVLALAICVPLYYFGKKYGGMTDDTLSWIVILIALPLLAIGFIKVQGLPMEKYFIVCLKFFFFPTKRKYQIDNVYRDIQNRAVKEEVPTSGKERRALEKQRKDENLERMFLSYEAEQNGKLTYGEEKSASDYDPIRRRNFSP